MAHLVHALAAIAALMAAAPAQAQTPNFDLPFRLINLSPLTIIEVQALALDGDEGWTGNMLRRGPLRSDTAVTFILPNAADLCIYDIAIFFSNRTYMQETVNVCESPEFTVYDPR